MEYRGLKQYSNYFLLALIALILIVTYNLSKSLIPTIFSAAILSISLYPLYQKLLKKLKSKNVTSFVIIFLVIVLILIPSLFLTVALIKESINAYNFVANLDLTQVSEKVSEWFGVNLDLNRYVKETLVGFATTMINSVRSLISQVIEVSIHLVVLLFLMFYFIRDGDKIVNGIKKYAPLKKGQASILINGFSSTTKAVIYGIVVTGVLQWIATSLGFWALGVPNPILWGLIIFIAAILPVIGASPIWGAAAIYLLATGHVVKAIILALYGMIVISGIETFIKPIIVGSRSNIHPGVILVGFIGGITIWGFGGILIGPIVLSLLVSLLRLYTTKDEKAKD